MPRPFDFKNSTDEQITEYIKKLVDAGYQEGKSDGEEAQTERSYTSKKGDAGDTNTAYITDVTNLTEVGKGLESVIKDFEAAANPENFKGADYLRDASQEMANSLGLGQARMSEMKTTIADAIPEMLRLGIEENDALDAMVNIPKQLGINTSLGKEALVEMAAAADVTGVNVGKLATEFKGVGISLYDVGDKMAEVANYAKSVGVNVKAVSQEVVTNLKQLNLYNFDNGVKGLAKMAAQASMLGIDMATTFELAEDLMSPEKAIDLSAALQRLGVSSSALLDPLKAMDLAQNDPEALQKEIINVSKEFTKLKADGSGFEILPGAKRRLREVAQAMGMSATELANMSIKSADLDMKMSKIKFPSLASSEEDKLLIANMAQMKGGEAVLQIKNDITGKMDEINVKDLTADQITKLKEQQADQNKSIEELAIDQLNVLESIDAGINGAKAAVNLGKASTPAIDRFYNTMNVLREESVKVLTSGVNTGNVREGFKGITQPLESGVIDLLKGNVSFESLSSVVDELSTNVRTTLAAIAQGATDNLINSGQNTVNRVSEIYGATGKVEATNIKVDQDNPILKKLGEYIELIKPGVTTETKTTADVNMNIKVDAGSSLPNGLTPAQFTPAIEKYFETPEGKSNLTKWITDNNSGLTTGKP